MAKNLDSTVMLYRRRLEGLVRFYRMRRLCGDAMAQAGKATWREIGPWISGRRNVVEGFAFHHLPLVASYSRSGTNLVRYAVEFISGRSTPGQKRLYKCPAPVFDRAHKAFGIMDRHPRVILLLRDYRECLLRQHLELWKRKPEVRAFLEASAVLQPPDWYIRNVEAFDRFQGDKLVIYYEDLLHKPEPALRTLCSFLGLEPSKVEAFLREIHFHYQGSIELYTGTGHASLTSIDKNIRAHSDKWLAAKQRHEFDAYYREKYPDLYQRYLKRYEIEKESGSPA